MLFSDAQPLPGAGMWERGAAGRAQRVPLSSRYPCFTWDKAREGFSKDFEGGVVWGQVVTAVLTDIFGDTTSFAPLGE